MLLCDSDVCTLPLCHADCSCRGSPGGCAGVPRGAPLMKPCVLQMEERRDSMLETASRCFQAASQCEGDGDEEEWLIHYMLGKIAEKRKQPPKDYLLLYKQVWIGVLAF